MSLNVPSAASKDWCRVATRYDKLAHNYRAAVVLTAIILYWL